MQDAALAGALAAPGGPASGPWGRRLYRLSRAFAFAGGAGLLLLVLMSLVSIIGRKLAAAPVPGDIEMMQMGGAVAAAAMLPFCEMERQHLRVDFFTARLAPRMRHGLDAFSHLLLAIVAAVVAWRTAAGALSLREAGESSMMLMWPVWTVVAALVPSFVLRAAAGLYNACAYARSCAMAAHSPA